MIDPERIRPELVEAASDVIYELRATAPTVGSEALSRAASASFLNALIENEESMCRLIPYHGDTESMRAALVAAVTVSDKQLARSGESTSDT